MARRSCRAGAIGALLLALAALTPFTGASAASTGAASISHVQRSGDQLQILVSVPANATVDLTDVNVTIAGTAAVAVARQADTTTAVRRTAVLAIDTSNSMAGPRFAAAKAAARTFLDTVPDDVYVGIVSFNSSVDQALPPTLDRAAAKTVIGKLTLARKTLLYNGVLGAVRMAGTEGQRSLLVLSDGSDTSSTKLSDVTARVEDTGVLLDAVTLEQGKQTPKPLVLMARAGHGRVVQATSGALKRTFTAEADVLARQVLVTAEVPGSVTASEGTVAVTIGSSSGALTARAFAPLGDSSSAAPSAAGGGAVPSVPVVPKASPLGSLWLYAGLGALLLGLLTVLALLVPQQRRTMTAAERAVAYVEHVTVGPDASSSEPDSEPALEQAREAAESFLSRNRSLDERISARLAGAGSDLKSAEWLLLHVGIFIGAGLVGILLGSGNPVLGIVFLILGAWGPWWFLGFKRSRRRKKFEQLLPDTLQLMSGSLAAGLSLAQSVDTVAKEGQDPVASEFQRVLVETRLGIGLEDALDGIAERFESKDFGWVVMAIKIQRQVGGNLGELLDNVAATIREREYMRRQVATLSAEGKMSAYVLGGLPPGFMLYLFVSNRPYVMTFFTEPLGWAMLVGMVMLLSLGIFWMSRLVKVEV